MSLSELFGVELSPLFGVSFQCGRIGRTPPRKPGCWAWEIRSVYCSNHIWSRSGPLRLVATKAQVPFGGAAFDCRHEGAKYLTPITEIGLLAQLIAVPIEDLLKLYKFVRIQFVLDLL